MKALRTSGFTLIELLVAIAIISVLALMLTSVTSKVQQSGKSTENLNNLKQLAASYLAYAADNNGRTPETLQNVSGGKQGLFLTTGIDAWPHGGPRRLFQKDKWPFGTGIRDYLGSPDVFYGPFTPIANKARKKGEMWENVPTAFRIGYVYFYLPEVDDSDKRGEKQRKAPLDETGRPLRNDRLADGHPRAPLFSDIYNQTWADMLGFPLAQRSVLYVVHLDGSADAVSKEKALKAKNIMLFLAGLEK